MKVDIKIDDRWCIHSYYTISPYANDGSGRLLLSGANLDKNYGEIYVLNDDGKVTDIFGKNALYSAFYHTGYWQTWSEDSRYVYYQAGVPEKPKIGIYDTVCKKEYFADGDMEGAPPRGNVILSGLMGMLYAAGYADGKYHKDRFPVAYDNRDAHGIFAFDIFNNKKKLILSINDAIKMLEDEEKQKIYQADKKVKEIYGGNEKLTLMCYCVRWNRQGTRCLFYLGNHSAPSARDEESFGYIFTADKNFTDVHIALNLTGKKSCHWSWHPDGEHIIGYVEIDSVLCLAQVKYDGMELLKIHDSNTCGHVSVNPYNYKMAVTDTYEKKGRVQILNLSENIIDDEYRVQRCNCDEEPRGRNPHRVCNHPVFIGEGNKLLVNCLEDRNAYVKIIEIN